MPAPTQAEILEWAKIHHERNQKKYPSVESGEIFERDCAGGYKPTERNWSAVNQSLKQGYVQGWKELWGDEWKKGRGLPDFLRENGLSNKNPAIDTAAQMTELPKPEVARREPNFKAK